MRNKGWLASDWDSRNPSQDLNDIDTGKYLTALSQLPNNIKQMMYDSDMHITVDEINGYQRIVKTVKKREPEYLQGSKNFFVLDVDGNRIPLDEEEWDKLTGGRRNQEDVYEYEGVELQGLEEFNTPMDVWDIIYDVTAFVQKARSLARADLSQDYKLKLLEQSKKEDIYSSDYFPYTKDKRLHSNRAEEIRDKILNDGVTRRQLANMLRTKRDYRLDAVKKLKVEGKKMALGKKRAEILLRAQRIQEDIRKKPFVTQNEIAASDKAKLWWIWRDHEMFTKGSVELTSWQFERMYRYKLQRLGVYGKEANQLIKERMAALYGSKPTQPEPPTILIAENVDLPDWLTEIPQEEVVEEDYDFDLGDWMDINPPIETEELQEDSWDGEEW